MSKNIVECYCLDEKTTQYIERNISEKFIDLHRELYDRKVPSQHILRGSALALAKLLSNTTEAKNSSQEISKIIDDVVTLLEKYQKKGVDYPSQAAALAFCVPSVLGINYDNLE